MSTKFTPNPMDESGGAGPGLIVAKPARQGDFRKKPTPGGLLPKGAGVLGLVAQPNPNDDRPVRGGMFAMTPVIDPETLEMLKNRWIVKR